VKCIYIDPPYNTGNAFEHYKDGLEHSEWLCLMKPRLEILYNFLSDDGSIWISIDDDDRTNIGDSFSSILSFAEDIVRTEDIKG